MMQLLQYQISTLRATYAVHCREKGASSRTIRLVSDTLIDYSSIQKTIRNMQCQYFTSSGFIEVGLSSLRSYWESHNPSL